MLEMPNDLILGFHGTTTRFVDAHLRQEVPITNFSGDWLGHGYYFWERDADRAADWAEKWVVPRHGGEAAVLVAAIDISNCLDLTRMADRKALELAGRAIYENMSEEERSKLKQTSRRRELDCAAVDVLVRSGRRADRTATFTTVRGAFQEGSPLYRDIPGVDSGVWDRDHIQINVVDRSAIRWLRRLER